METLSSFLRGSFLGDPELFLAEVFFLVDYELPLGCYLLGNSELLLGY